MNEIRVNVAQTTRDLSIALTALPLSPFNFSLEGGRCRIAEDRCRRWTRGWRAHSLPHCCTNPRGPAGGASADVADYAFEIPEYSRFHVSATRWGVRHMQYHLSAEEQEADLEYPPHCLISLVVTRLVTPVSMFQDRLFWLPATYQTRQEIVQLKCSYCAIRLDQP